MNIESTSVRFEYPANNARLGSFEIVLPLLDAMNNIESNRMDGIEQVIQAFIKFVNCDISKEEYEDFIRMYDMYHDKDKLDGNGLLKELKEEVDNLEKKVH